MNMKRKKISLFIIAVFFTTLYGCGCIIPEVIFPLYAPTPGGMTPSSIDQQCRKDAFTKIAGSLFEHYKETVKGDANITISFPLANPSSQEAADYIYRAFRNNKISADKSFDNGEAASSKYTYNLNIYPVVDGALNSEIREKLGEERGCEVVIHTRLNDLKNKKVLWTKDFSAKSFVNSLIK